MKLTLKVSIIFDAFSGDTVYQPAIVSHCWDKTPNTSNLREAWFVLAQGFRDFSPLSAGSRTERSQWQGQWEGGDGAKLLSLWWPGNSKKKNAKSQRPGARCSRTTSPWPSQTHLGANQFTVRGSHHA